MIGNGMIRNAFDYTNIYYFLSLSLFFSFFLSLSCLQHQGWVSSDMKFVVFGDEEDELNVGGPTVCCWLYLQEVILLLFV